MEFSFSLTEAQHRELMAGLFPIDEQENIAFILCGNCINEERHRFLANKIYFVRIKENFPGSDITNILQSIFEIAQKHNLSIFKIHGYNKTKTSFSDINDISDIKLFPQIYTRLKNDIYHGSLKLLPDGTLMGKIMTKKYDFLLINNITVIGANLSFQFNNIQPPMDFEEFALKSKQAFGEGTFNKLRALRVAVIGCSGTGSLVIEQLVRLGVGKLLLVDPDILEVRNINRICYSTIEDARNKIPKVKLFEKVIKSIGIGTQVESLQANLFNSEVINKVKNVDVIFGCMDTIDGRHLLNRLSNFYLLPFFDLGVRIIADGKGGISNMVGSEHYLQPGKSTLLSREVYTLKKLESSDLMRTDPEEYQERLKSKYIDGVNVERPAVISINNLISSLAINDFLSRIHNFRYLDNNEIASTTFNFCDWSLLTQKESDYDQNNIFSSYIGIGDISPLLNLPSLS